MTAGVYFCSSSVLRTASSSQCTSSSTSSGSSRGCLFFRSSSSLSSCVERDGGRRIGRGKKFVAFASSSSNDNSNKTSESLQSSSVFLLGLMGTGKTTVGKKLAETLGYGYFDTDQLIEQITKQKVHEIFEEDGEEGFRETESAILAEVASYKRVVVSTGGGIVTVRNNWMHLHNGVTVCLQGDHRTLARRVHKDGVGARPLLKECLSEEDEEAQITKIEEKIQSLWRDRGKMYAECDIAVSVNGEEDEAYGASVETIVERICKSIDKRLREDGKQEKLRKGPEVGDIEVKDLKTGERIDKVD
ncbi:unnamed protein product [Bathycoccus prasinos]